MNRALHWLRARMGVRVVSALAAAAAVAVVLAVAGVALVVLLDHSLRASYERSADQQASLLGQRIAANFSGTGDAKQNAIDATGKRTDIVQVLTDYNDDSDDPDAEVGSNGTMSDVQVIGSSDTLDQVPRIVPWLLAPGETRVVPSAEVQLADGSTEEVTIVGKGLRATGRPITVLAAQPLKPVHQAVDTVSVMVTVGIPLLVLVAGFFTYLFAGRALRPVEEIRRRVAGLTDRDLARRVPEPVTRDEVGRLARTMNEMLSRLEASQATQRRFVADASHELRSPLATVSTGLELLGSGLPEDSADRGTVRTLRGETNRLTKLVEGLLFLARADERGVAPRREEVDLDEIAEGERTRPSADDRVAVTVSTEPVRVVGDRGQLVRVVRNLVDNARRHASSSVAVAVRAEGETAVVEVDDDGPGVPEDDRTRVFERFVRLDEARAREDGGSGLGLAIVAELVAAHGGTVTAAEAPGLGGARFRVAMPLAGTAGAFPVGEPDAGAASSPRPDDEAEPASDAGRQTAPERPAEPVGAGSAGTASAATATDGTATNGAATTGAAANGSAANGAVTHGAASHGAASHGAAASGAAATGSASNWVAANGAASYGAATPGPARGREDQDTTDAAGSAAALGAAAAAAAMSAGRRERDQGEQDRADRAQGVSAQDDAASGGQDGTRSGGARDEAGPGPFRRVPMGGRRRSSAEPLSGPLSGPSTGSSDDISGTDGEPGDTAATPVPRPADPTSPRPRPTPNGPRTGREPLTPHPAARPRVSDPPTGPLPIRPTSVGSPADENATRPLPVVRPGSGRTGTAVAPSGRRDVTADGSGAGRDARPEASSSGARSLPGQGSRNGFGQQNGTGRQNGSGHVNGGGGQNGVGPPNGTGPQNAVAPQNGTGPQNAVGRRRGIGPQGGVGPQGGARPNGSARQSGSGPQNGPGRPNGSGAPDSSGAPNGPGAQGPGSQNGSGGPNGSGAQNGSAANGSGANGYARPDETGGRNGSDGRNGWWRDRRDGSGPSGS